MDAYAAGQPRDPRDDGGTDPAIEPLSLDEAFLDLTGTAAPARRAARGAAGPAGAADGGELGLTGSVGLSHNKFLAKVASDLDKPRGFAVIGRAETADFLRDRPVRLIWGVGAPVRRRWRRGHPHLRRPAALGPRDLVARFGSLGDRLHGSRAGRTPPREPATRRSSRSRTRPPSARTPPIPTCWTAIIWRLAEKVSDRAKAKGLAGKVVTLKLKRADFRS
jgi:DNA polymerase IV